MNLSAKLDRLRGGDNGRRVYLPATIPAPAAANPVQPISRERSMRNVWKRAYWCAGGYICCALMGLPTWI